MKYVIPLLWLVLGTILVDNLFQISTILEAIVGVFVIIVYLLITSLGLFIAINKDYHE